MKVEANKELYTIRTKKDDGTDNEYEFTVNPNGDYIGSVKTAKYLCDTMGIKPETLKNQNRVCSIGFSERDGKWYGWSHRAIHGFEIGSKVVKGDCAYTPTDEEDARLDAIRFWKSDTHIDVTAESIKDDDGKLCFKVEWTRSDDIPNEKLRSTIGGVRHYPPEEFGRGEWTAKTIEDARQMASDFAFGVN